MGGLNTARVRASFAEPEKTTVPFCNYHKEVTGRCLVAPISAASACDERSECRPTIHIHLAERIRASLAASTGVAGAYTAVLGGLDAFVFTAGIGEHSAPVRAALCAKMAWLGVRLDEQANKLGGPRISTPDSAVSVWVIPTNEELMIAQHTLALIRPSLR